MTHRHFLLALLLAVTCHAQVLMPAKVSELRAQIAANFHVPEPLPALDLKTHRRFDPAPGVRAEAISYTTQVGTRVPAILYLPNPLPNDAKLPGFIVVNGHGGDKYAWYSYYTGILLARGGAAVLTYDQAGEGERNPERKSGTRAHDKITGDDARARKLCGLMLTDVRQAVSVLTSRPEVDAKRIGAGGYSLGSFVLALAGAIEPRLKACVLVGGGNLDGPDGYWDKSKPMCQGLPYRSLGFLGDRPAMIYALHAARGPALVWNGLADTVVGMEKTPPAFFDDLRARVAALHGGEEGILDTAYVTGMSHRPYFLTRGVIQWLEQHLDFPIWTADSLAKLPEVRIADWAAKHGIAMDKLYAAENREGGLRAPDVNVPGFKREDLHVLSDDEWASDRHAFTLDTWIKAATGGEK